MFFGPEEFLFQFESIYSSVFMSFELILYIRYNYLRKCLVDSLTIRSKILTLGNAKKNGFSFALRSLNRIFELTL